MATAETARDALAEYMHVLLKADAFWYSIDSNHSHGFSLCSRFGMSQRDFEALLLAANLAKCSDKFGFRSNLKEWKSFIDSYRFRLDGLSKLQVESKRIDVYAHIDGYKPSPAKRERFNVIQIGMLSFDPANPSTSSFEKQKNKAGLQIVVPPPLKQIRQYQRTLGRTTARIILDTIIDYDYLYAMDNRISCARSVLPVRPATPDAAPTVSPTEVLKANRIDAHDDTETEESPTKRIKINLCEDMDASLTPTQTPIPIHMPTVAEAKYPTLSQVFGGDFDPDDSEAQTKIDSLLSEIAALREHDYEISYKNEKEQVVSFVRVPRPGSPKAWNNTKGSLDTFIRINGAKNSDTYDSVACASNHMWRHYNDSIMDGTKKHGVPICTPMTETAFVSMLQESNVNGLQQKVLTKHLRKHLGKSFLPTKDQINMLCEGHTPINTSTVQHKYNLDSKEETI